MSEQRVWPISNAYFRPIRVALSIQIPVAIFCLLLLDGGQLANFCGITMIGFWSGAALVIIRRPHTPTEADTTLIQYAFVPLFPVSMVIARIMQRWP